VVKLALFFTFFFSSFFVLFFCFSHINNLSGRLLIWEKQDKKGGKKRLGSQKKVKVSVVMSGRFFGCFPYLKKIFLATPSDFLKVLPLISNN